MSTIKLFMALLLVPSFVHAAQFERINQTSASTNIVPGTSSKQKAVAVKTLPIKASPGSTFATATSPTVASSGVTHTRYQQLINGTPIWTAEMIVHEGKSNRVTGKILKDIDTSAISSALYSQDEIYEYVVSILNKKFMQTSNLKIVKRSIKPYIFKKKDGSLVNVLLVDVFVMGDSLISRPQVMVDASTLSVVKFWDGLQHLSVEGSGPGGNEKTGRYDYGDDFSTFLVSEQSGTCTMENSNVKAVDLLHSMDELFGESNNNAFSYDCSGNNEFLNAYKEINGAYSPINDAFFFGNLVFDMYDQWYSTSPLPSPEPMQLSMKVHLGSNLENAFWTGDAMLFGDGGANFYPLVDINVSSHEVSHGFTQFNSDLIYSNESGGMNEAFSDMAGEAAEFFMRGEVDWLVGADIYRGEGALRYFEDPNQDGRSIKHVDNYYDGLDVHLSSGIYNHAFYLLANTQGWSVKTAFDVFVYANQNYWIADETFSQGACGTLSSANDLNYNATDVALAFMEVGLECPTFFIDSDQDSMNDIWEIRNGFNPQAVEDATSDFDNDGLTNLEEYQLGLEAKFNDSDWDGLHDGEEITLGTDPLKKDTDNDGMDDGFEVSNGLLPGVDDGLEDQDGDGLNNLVEFINELNPDARDELIPTLITNATDTFNQYISPDWENENDLGWQRIESNDEFVLASDEIDDAQSAQIDIEMYTRKGSELLFDLKTSTESGWDFFVLKVNGTPVYSLSGVHDWQPINYKFKQEGVVKVSFVYQKDFIISEGDDRVYIDNITRPVQFAPADIDNDEIADYWASYYDIENPALDQDGDGLTNLEEFLASSSPLLIDSDKDGLSDALEVNQHNTSPINKDSDYDGIPDGDEIDAELDPLDDSDAQLDFDSDGYSNIAEILYGGAVNNQGIQPMSLLNFINDFNESEADHVWNSTEQLALPYENYGKWLVIDHSYKPQAIANRMLAIAHFKNLFEAGVLSFDLSMNTEEYDEFIVYIDGEVYEHFSGEQNKEVLVWVKDGIHEVSFVYKKNSSRSSAVDSVAIDNLRFLAYGDFDGDGLPNSDEILLETDLRSPDSDGDGHNDSNDAFPNDDSEWLDSDNDSYGDNIDFAPRNSTEWKDSDLDGYGDNQDVFQNDPSEWLDSDNDGHGDNSDYYPYDDSKWEKKDNSSGIGSISYLGLLLLMLFSSTRRVRR